MISYEDQRWRSLQPPSLEVPQVIIDLIIAEHAEYLRCGSEAMQVVSTDPDQHATIYYHAAVKLLELPGALHQLTEGMDATTRDEVFRRLNPIMERAREAVESRDGYELGVVLYSGDDRAFREPDDLYKVILTLVPNN